MDGIRKVDLGTFVSSADATHRVRSTADTHERVQREPGQQNPGHHHRGSQQQPQPEENPAETEDAGTYDDHGRLDQHETPATPPGTPAAPHVNIVL